MNTRVKQCIHNWSAWELLEPTARKDALKLPYEKPSYEYYRYCPVCYAMEWRRTDKKFLQNHNI